MLKLSASYSKKAWDENSSQGFSASIEVEETSDLASNPNKLQEKLHWIWKELKNSVEQELNGAKENGHSKNNNGSNGNGNGNKEATEKQINFLKSLAKKKENFSLDEYVKQETGKNLNELNRKEASGLIEKLK